MGGEIALEQVATRAYETEYYAKLSRELFRRIIGSDSSKYRTAKAGILLAQLPLISVLAQGEMPTKGQLKKAYTSSLEQGASLTRGPDIESQYDPQAIGLATDLSILLICQRGELAKPNPESVAILASISQKHASYPVSGLLGSDISFYGRPIIGREITPDKQIRVRRITQDMPSTDVVCLNPNQAIGLSSDHGSVPIRVLGELYSEASSTNPNPEIPTRLDQRYAQLAGFLLVGASV